MNISLDWLNTYLNQPADAAETERVLTDVGFPIDGITFVGNDTILDVEVTSNRPDCLSHIGVAREFAAATGRELVLPDLPKLESSSDAVGEITSVENLDHNRCPFYTARVIHGVKIAPSPAWLVQRIEAIGLRAVNNIVDITNFVLHETGQPLHAFDLDLLAEQRIVVRQATDGEPFTAIDGSQHKLTTDMLVIADGKSPQAVAGIMGGQTSEVSDSTVNVLLESAQFDPLNVRTTSRALKLASDSSYRFERGVSTLGVELASQRAIALIQELAGGKIAKGILSVGGPQPAAAIVTMRPSRCSALLGYKIPTPRMVELLNALGFQPHVNDDEIACTVPPHRLDIHREVDLIEEVARMNGFDHVPMQEKMRLVVRKPQTSVLVRKSIATVLTAQGFCEAINFSFIEPRLAEPFGNSHRLVHVDEEKKKSEPALRPSLLPSLLRCRKANQDAGNRDVRMFEIAKTFVHGQGDSILESAQLAMIGDAEDAGLAVREMRGTIDALFAAMGCGRCEISDPKEPARWADPAVQADIIANGNRIGAFGLLHKDTQKLFDLQSPIVAAQLDYDLLVTNFPPQPSVQALAKFPAIERDLSIVIDEATRWAEVDDLIRRCEPKLMDDVKFVTTYRGKQVPKGRKSLTLRMIFRHPQRTLLHDEVSTQVETVMKVLKDNLTAEVRV